MDGPWNSYPAGTPEAQPYNWGYNNGTGQYYLVGGPDDPSRQTATTAPSTYSTGEYTYDPLSSSYQPAAEPRPNTDGTGTLSIPVWTPDLPGGQPYDGSFGYYDENGNYIYAPAPGAPPATGAVSPAGTNADIMASGYGAYDPLSSAYQPAPGPPAQPAYSPESSAYTPPVQPTPGIFSPVAPGGTYTPQPSDYGPAAGPVDYNYVYDPSAAAAPVGVSAPPQAPGGAAAPMSAPAAPITTSTDPVTGQVIYTDPVTGQPSTGDVSSQPYASDPYSGGGGGGYDQGYGGGSGGGYMGGAPPAFPNGQGFGAPHQMGANGQFDPFAWAGVGNPRPAPNASQLYVLQQLGLAPRPQAPPKPMGPIAYTAAKLGIEAPDTQFSFPNPMQQPQDQPPAAWPPQPPSMARQMSTAAPQANAPQLPDLPMLPIPRRGNFRT